MEKKYIYYPFMVLAMTVALSSCDDFWMKCRITVQNWIRKPK